MIECSEYVLHIISFNSYDTFMNYNHPPRFVDEETEPRNLDDLPIAPQLWEADLRFRASFSSVQCQL